MSNTPFTCVRVIFSIWFICGYIAATGQTNIDPKRILQKAAHFEAIKDKGNLINSYTLLGKYYTEKEQFELGLKYLSKAKKLNPEDSLQYTAYNAGFSALFKRIGAINESLEYEKRILSRNINDLGGYYASSNLGGGYIELNQKDSALFYFIRQLKIANNFQDYIAISSANNNIGLTHFYFEEYDLALHYFNKALEIFDSKEPHVNTFFVNEETSFRSSILENKGRTLYHLKKYQEAIEILTKTVSKQKNSSFKNELDDNIFALFDSYLKTNRSIEANRIIANNIGVLAGPNTADKLMLYRMKLEYAIATNNQPQIAHAYQKIKLVFNQQQREQRIAGNAMSQVLTTYLIMEMQEKIEREKEKRAFYASKLEFANAKTTFTLIMSGFFTFLVAISVYLYIQSSRNKKRKLDLANQLLQIENEKHALKIQVQEKTLTDFAIDYNKNKERENYFIQKLKALGKLKPVDVHGELNSTISEIQMRLKIDDKIEDLTNESHQLQEEFREKLLQAHPDLTKSDIQLCLLLRLELSNKEIAAYRSVTVDSVKIFKNRLRTKLQLESAEQLVAYLKNI